MDAEVVIVTGRSNDFVFVVRNAASDAANDAGEAVSAAAGAVNDAASSLFSGIADAVTGGGATEAMAAE